MQELFFYIDIYDESRERVVRFNILKDTGEKILGTVKYFVEEKNMNSYNNSCSYSKLEVTDILHQQHSGNQKFPALVIKEDNFKNIALYNQVKNNILYCPEYFKDN